MKIRPLAGGALVLAALSGLAACGTPPPRTTATLAPRDAVATATQALLDGQNLTVTVHLDTTPAALMALENSPDSPPMSNAQAAAISDGSIVSAEHVVPGQRVGNRLRSTQALTDASDAESVLVRAGNGATAELRLVDGALYARADVAGFADLGDKPLLARAAIAGAALGAGVPAPYRAAVAAGLGGHWLSVSATVVAKDAALLTTLSNTTAVGASSELSIETSLLAAVEKQAVVTRLSSHGGDDHLRAAVQLPQLSEDFDAAIASAFKLPGGEDTTSTDTPPNQAETIDITTHDGVLSQLRLDLAADLLPKTRAALHGAPLVVIFDFSADPVSIPVPSATTAVDPTALLQSALAAEKADDADLRDDSSSGASTSLGTTSGDGAPSDFPTDVPCPSGLPAATALCKNGMLIPPSN